MQKVIVLLVHKMYITLSFEIVCRNSYPLSSNIIKLAYWRFYPTFSCSVLFTHCITSNIYHNCSIQHFLSIHVISQSNKANWEINHNLKHPFLFIIWYWLECHVEPIFRNILFFRLFLSHFDYFISNSRQRTYIILLLPPIFSTTITLWGRLEWERECNWTKVNSQCSCLNMG